MLGGVAALIIAIPTMRLQGHYFALATLAFGEVMRVIANVWTSLTGGPVGLSVPFVPPSFAAYSFKQLLPHAYIALIALDHRHRRSSRRSGAVRWAIGCAPFAKIRRRRK